MKEKKTIEIKTGAFELKIFWNGPFMSLQFTILLGLFLLTRLTPSEAVRNLAYAALFLDGIAVLLYMLSANKFEDVEVSSEGTTEKETLDVEIEHDKNTAGTKKTVSTVDGTIKNKVPIPNTSQTQPKSEPTPEPEQEPTPIPTPTVNVQVDKQAEEVEQNTGSVGDWQDFF